MRRLVVALALVLAWGGEGRAGAVAPGPATSIGIQETSLQFSDSRAQQRHDVRVLFLHARAARNVLLAGTEASSATALYRLLPQIGHAHDFGVFVSRTGEWVAWDRTWGSLVRRGHVRVVPAVSRRRDRVGHRERGITWATIRPRDRSIGLVTIGAVHYLTRNALRIQPRGNLLLRRAAAIWTRLHGRDSRLAFLAGDTNTNDRRRDPFPWILRTAWDALHRYPGTRKGAPIDVIARDRYDGRTRFLDARSFPRLPGYSDHNLISARVRIERIP